MIWPQCCVLENSRLTPRGDLPAAERPQHCVLVDVILTPKSPVLAKMVLLSVYLQNRASDFDDFCTDVRDSFPE